MTAAGILLQPSTREARPWLRAFLWLLALGPFFFFTYGLANSFTSQRQHVPTLVFGWEQNIPFLAWTILPYWSIDFFYAVSLFICATQLELTTHVKRLIAAQSLSVAGFLLAPLQFTFARPETHGFFGWMFEVLMGFDKPFNQAPSLHLSLAVILGAKYAAHLSGAARRAMQVWFVMIGLSTLTTYQHHFIDLPTGAWVGLLCLVLFTEQPEASRQAPAYRIAAIYLAGSLACGVLAFTLGGITWLLLWPAGALLFVAAAYACGRPGLFRKQSGKLPWSTKWLLAPYLAGAKLNALWWTRRAAPAQEIAPGVWVGRIPFGAERARAHYTSLVDLTSELSLSSAGLSYRNVPMLDLALPGVEQINEAVLAISDLRGERPTLVCCALGYSRSATAAAAWLIASGEALSVNDAIAIIRKQRPEIVLHEAHRERLAEWVCARRHG